MSTATSPKSVTEVPFWMGTATIFRRELFAFFTCLLYTSPSPRDRG